MGVTPRSGVGDVLQVIIDHNASSRMPLNPRGLGQFVTRLYPDSIYDEISVVDGTVLQLKASEHLVVGAIICRPHELVCGRTVGEDVHAHGFDLEEDHLACVGVQLTQEGVGLPVDDADVLDPVPENG
jgi:hypothetical protein